MKSVLKSLMAAPCLAAMLSVSACATSSVDHGSVQTEASMTQPLVLDLDAGQVLQFAFFKGRDGEAAKAVRARYFETAIPHARSLGDEHLGNLRVADTLIGENAPQGMALYAFPNEDAWRTFQQSPEWDEYQRMRREGWEELHIFSVILSDNTQMMFDPAKDYTFAAAWTRPGTMPSYQTYLDGIEADFDEIGARYVAQLRGVSMQSQTDLADDPSQITIVEWSEGPNLRGLQRTQAYKDHAEDFQAAITRFDLYQIGTTG